MSEMIEYILRRDDGPDLRFEGEMLGKAETTPDHASADYSGAAGRWTKIALYRTKAGKLVGQRIQYTAWQGESHGYEAQVFANEDEAIAWFELDQKFRDLMEQCGIRYEEVIE